MQVEEKLGEALKQLDLLPEGYQCSARLHGKSRDKKRTASFEKSWSPDTDSIHIRFERTPEQASTASQPGARGTATAPSKGAAKSGATITDPLSDLIQALDRAESRPGFAFVALKWFRDAALPAEGFSWASADSVRQDVLRDAIDKRGLALFDLADGAPQRGA